MCKYRHIAHNVIPMIFLQYQFPIIRDKDNIRSILLNLVEDNMMKEEVDIMRGVHFGKRCAVFLLHELPMILPLQKYGVKGEK